jgi:hypothetical protein
MKSDKDLKLFPSLDGEQGDWGAAAGILAKCRPGKVKGDNRPREFF